ncbi:MAG TPA: PaaI family thioesterase [Pyrinomonadaceae bacterium]|nr:PaaI family thioesterase [Pyrinomonadaceae bacterium]
MDSTEITDEVIAFARERLSRLPVAKYVGMRLDSLSNGSAVISLEMHEGISQPSGIMHGGITATLIDTAMAFALRTIIGAGPDTATVDLTVHYLRPIATGRAVCRAKVLRAGRRFYTISAEVFDENENLAAHGISTYTVIKKE